MDADADEDVLKKGLLPIYEAQNIFQQNRDPCHKSRLVSSSLDKSQICDSVIGRCIHQI